MRVGLSRGAWRQGGHAVRGRKRPSFPALAEQYGEDEMPIKIFAAPGDQRNDFETVEIQANEWIASAKPTIQAMQTTVNQAPGAKDSNQFVMTLVLLYDESGA